MVFRSVSPTFWSPEFEGDLLEGVLVSKEFGVGRNNSSIYAVKLSDGSLNKFWGCAVLDSKMQFVNIGDLIRVTYEGLGEGQNGKNPPKLFDVEVDESENLSNTPVIEVGGVSEK